MVALMATGLLSVLDMFSKTYAPFEGKRVKSLPFFCKKREETLETGISSRV